MGPVNQMFGGWLQSSPGEDPCKPHWVDCGRCGPGFQQSEADACKCVECPQPDVDTKQYTWHWTADVTSETGTSTAVPGGCPYEKSECNCEINAGMRLDKNDYCTCDLK